MGRMRNVEVEFSVSVGIERYDFRCRMETNNEDIDSFILLLPQLVGVNVTPNGYETWVWKTTLSGYEVYLQATRDMGFSRLYVLGDANRPHYYRLFGHPAVTTSLTSWA